jgi:hypothetical protein
MDLEKLTGNIQILLLDTSFLLHQGLEEAY